MNFLDICNAVDERRPLSLLSSLPVIMKSGDILEIMWFYFSYQKGTEKSDMRVSSICTTKDGETVSEKSVLIQEKVQWCEGAEPEMDEADYYDQLEQLYEAFDPELMTGLLQKAEHPTFLKLYERVTAYLENPEQEETELTL